MNKKLIFLVMLVCLLAFVAVWAFAQNDPGVRWEYTSLDYSSNVMERANKLGTEGWELVQITGSSYGKWIFKRRLP